ncbi:MAG TPA: PAS domain-containing protein, partial [Thermodesulfobacteriota bacterium]|nr:PAS domain-containing protein [Thermodesulfobacteriota bacterium]
MNLNASAKELKHRVEQLTERVAEFAEHEKKLRRSEGLLLAIMDHVPEGIVIVDAPDLKLRFASHYALCTIGSSPEEAKGAFGFFSRNPVFNPNGTPVDADSVLLRQVIENEELVKNLEVIVERPDGSRIPLLCNAAPVRDENKNVSGAIMSYMDVAERRRMEKELKKTHKELKTKVRQLSQQTVKLKTSEAHLHQLSSHLLEYQENERRRLANEIH